MTNTYIPIKEVANAKGISERAIRKSCQNGKYKFRKTKYKGGFKYEILFTSLEPEVQVKFTSGATFHTNINNVIAPVFLPNVVLGKKEMNILKKFNLDSAESEKVIPEAAKQKALYKVDLINFWLDARNRAKSKTKADKKFEELFNSNLIHQNLHNVLGDISIKSVYRWYKLYSQSGNNFEVLVDNYSYGSSNQLKTSLSDIEKYLLLKFMLHQNKYKLADAYELIVAQLKAMHITTFASESAYRRVWAYVCKNYNDIVVYSREGLKAALDTQLPYIQRDRSKLNVGDVIVGDGHVLDFMVKNPADGKAYRATLIGFMDWKSWEFLGYDIMFTENTQVIASALRNAIIKLGKMPKVVYIDNGRAFKNKTFGGQNLQEAGVQGLYEKLGIQTMFSKPYNGRSKVIERFWEELTGSLAKLLPSYIGNNIENQPAATKRNEKTHKKLQGEYIPTIKEVKAIIETWLDNIYRQRKCGADQNLTIAEYFDAHKGDGININILDDLMMTSEVRKVGRNGIKLFNELYYAPELTGLNTQIVAKYSMFDLSYVKVYSTNGEFICRADRTVSVHPAAELLGSPKDLAEYKEQQKKISKIQKAKISSTKRILFNLYDISTKSKERIISNDKSAENYKITCYEDVSIPNQEHYLINY